MPREGYYIYFYDLKNYIIVCLSRYYVRDGRC